jgi:hypothetical protein
MRGKNGKDEHSFAFARTLGRKTDPAQPLPSTAQARTGANAAPNRQAGGHWFEPSTAHRKPCRSAF